MVLFAFSIQDQVEKYGAYVGLAAFLGLAVLTVLYFAQARELKRLRDWAGRAPERAQEIEARVVATAEEARRAQTAPAAEPSGTVGPARPVEQPAAAAPSGNGKPAGKPAPIPIGPRPATAVAAAAARAQGTAVAAPPETTAGEAEEEAAPEVPAPATGDGDRPAEPVASQETQLHDTLGADAEPGDEAPPEEPQAEEPPPDEPEPAPSGNGVAAEPAIPRATPRPQPAAAPLRAASTSRPAPAPPRRAAAVSRDDGSSRAARITVLTLGGVVVVAALAFGATQILGGGDDAKPPPNVAQQPTSSADTGTGGGTTPTAAEARPETVVAILNGTPTQGLAKSASDKLVAEGYSEDHGMIRTGNNTDQQLQDSAVFYAPGKRRQARDVASILGISARPAAVDEDTLALANGVGGGGDSADVVAVLGLDQSP
jgi:hypothetical protein